MDVIAATRRPVTAVLPSGRTTVSAPAGSRRTARRKSARAIRARVGAATGSGWSGRRASTLDWWRSSDILLAGVRRAADVGDAAPVKAQTLQVDERRHLRGHQRVPDQHPPERAVGQRQARPVSDAANTRSPPCSRLICTASRSPGAANVIR